MEELWSGAVRPGLCVSVPEVGLRHGAVHQEDDVSRLGLRMLQGVLRCLSCPALKEKYIHLYLSVMSLKKFEVVT